MKLIHLTGAAAVFTVFALTAPSWLSPAMAQGAQGKMSELPSGLKYTDSKVGDGAAATAGHKVNVHYTGWLDNHGEKGKKFDSSLDRGEPFGLDRKSTRLNSSHRCISYAVFCLKKKKKKTYK